MLACNPCAPVTTTTNGRFPTAPPPASNLFSSSSGGRNSLRGAKRKKDKGAKTSSNVEKRQATAENVTTTSTLTTSTIVEKVKHFWPNSNNLSNGDQSCCNNTIGNTNNRSYTRMWKRRRRRKVSDESLLNDAPLRTKSDVNPCQRLLPHDPAVIDPTTTTTTTTKATTSTSSAKNKLLKIVQNDKMSKKLEEDEIKVDEEANPPFENVSKLSFENSSKTKTNSGGGFFQRGNSLISSVRSSLRKMGYIPQKRTTDDVTASPADVITTPTSDAIEEISRLKLEDANSNDSQDSGLGEDSDLGDLSVVTSPRTPPPGPVPILRLTTCSTSTTASKKHVVILEPNRTDLPSARRQLFRQSAPPRLETVRIRAPRIDSDDESDAIGTFSEGDVSGQWNNLCQTALAETEKVVQSLKLTHLEVGTSLSHQQLQILEPGQSLSIIFATSNLILMQQRLEELDSDGICRLIYILYRVLFFDWTSSKSPDEAQNNNIVAIVVHCIQRFLVVVINVCHELEPGTRLRLSRTFQKLLSKSENDRYQDLRNCLYQTRTVYIDFWCSLLEVRKNLAPFELQEEWL